MQNRHLESFIAVSDLLGASPLWVFGHPAKRLHYRSRVHLDLFFRNGVCKKQRLYADFGSKKSLNDSMNGAAFSMWQQMKLLTRHSIDITHHAFGRFVERYPDSAFLEADEVHTMIGVAWCMSRKFSTSASQRRWKTPKYGKGSQVFALEDILMVVSDGKIVTVYPPHATEESADA